MKNSNHDIAGQRFAATFALFASVLIMVEAELHFIHRTWYGPTPQVPDSFNFLIPLLIALPLIIGFVSRWRIKTWLGSGDISPAAAAQVNMNFGMVVMFSYLLMLLTAAH